MAEVLKEGEFWLPPEFLTDDYILMGKENFNWNELCFHSQFPYDLGDEEDISGLTRQFSRSTLQIPRKISFPPSNQEGKWVYSCSPRSTLSAAGSWSLSSNGSPDGFFQDPSPPTTPFVRMEETRNLIYTAADQVARMKMTLNNRDRALLAIHRSLAPPNYHCVSHSLCHHNHEMRPEPASKKQGYPILGKLERERWLPSPPPPPVHQSRGLRLDVENVRPLGSSQSARPCLPVQIHRQRNQLPQQSNAAAMNRAICESGGGRRVKRESAGTGVFIPRNPTESRRNLACSSALLPTLPARVFRPKPLTHFTGGLVPNLCPNFDLLIARRNEAMAKQQQQQRQKLAPETMMKHHEVMLPQEWTY